ncbi:type II toxin-antitoxin system VapC family toxin [Massilia sp. TN1-12]|uniref:type II toxin-antitoxin system VapC family toxin n=1 Tax=Massilia paldalensis TaxID=3377675 RepID=UPI00384C16C8
MALILFDTNIFIDMLNGVKQATAELTHYDKPAISVITYMELRAGEREHEKALLDAVLAEFEIIQIDQRVTDVAIEIRKRSLAVPPKVKLPDAIIGATAKVHHIPLVTRNPSDFVDRGIRVHVPYDFDSATGKVTNVREPASTERRIAITGLSQFQSFEPFAQFTFELAEYRPVSPKGIGAYVKAIKKPR